MPKHVNFISVSFLLLLGLITPTLSFLKKPHIMQIQSSMLPQAQLELKTVSSLIEDTSKPIFSYVVRNSTCNTVHCSEHFGKCEDQSTCVCKDGYVHAPLITHTKFDYCTYEQKKLLVSFFFEFILPFGVGHLYAHRIMIFMIKALLAVIVIAIVKYLICVQETTNDRRQPLLTRKPQVGLFFGVVLIVIIGTLHTYDLLCILWNKYLDGNGIPMKDI